MASTSSGRITIFLGDIPNSDKTFAIKEELVSMMLPSRSSSPIENMIVFISLALLNSLIPQRYY
ncbi:MAG: hypothetical protein LBP51_07565 [Deferribacteraceae bacterium]|nr:hypothetical protein [Deferribacteraceae bacterium]